MLVSAESSVEAAEARARAARGSWLPSLSLQAGFVTFGSTDGGFTGEWRGGIGLRYPIFTGGARSGRIQQAEAQALRAREEYRAATLATETQLDRALSAVAETDARIEATTQAVSHLEEVARIELLALEAGSGVQTDYLRAESDLYSARASLSDLRHRALTTRIQVAALTGDLSPEWVATYLEN
jgi:outer membrane protein TolC